MKKIDGNILQFRLEATRDAQKISRLAFLVSTIASLAIILSTWNTYFSWYTAFPQKEKFTGNEVTDEVQREVIKQWVDSSTISIPFLGIKVGVSDAPVFGSIGLLIINTWFFLSMRRENHVIGFLLRDTSKEIDDVRTREWIYHGIAAYLLFISITKKDEPIREIKKWRDKQRPNSIMQIAFKALVFLPPISILFLIISDILTVYVKKASFRYPHTPLFGHLNLGAAVKLITMDALAFALLILITVLCAKIVYYAECTGAVLREYADDIRRDFKEKA